MCALFVQANNDCFAVSSTRYEEMAVSELMQPFDLKAVMKAIIVDAVQKNIFEQLPSGFIACYEALEQGSPVLHCADLLEAFPIILGALVPEMVERTISYNDDEQCDKNVVKYASENNVIFR